MYIANFEIRSKELIIFPKVVSKTQHVYWNSKKKVINRFKTKQKSLHNNPLGAVNWISTVCAKRSNFFFFVHTNYSKCLTSTDLVTSVASPQICSEANSSYYLPVYCCWIVCANHEKFIFTTEKKVDSCFPDDSCPWHL